MAFSGATKLSILCVDLIVLIGSDELDPPDLLSLPSGHLYNKDRLFLQNQY